MDSYGNVCELPEALEKELSSHEWDEKLTLQKDDGCHLVILAYESQELATSVEDEAAEKDEEDTSKALSRRESNVSVAISSAD